MKIALLQLEVLEKNKAANVAHGLQLAAEAAQKHDLLVLPEVWTTGYSLGHLEQEAETPASPVLAQLAEIARNEQCAILAGSVPMRHADGKITIPLRLSIKTVKSLIFMIRCIFSAFSMKRISLLPAIIFKPLH